jgi:hypothetical protein
MREQRTKYRAWQEKRRAKQERRRRRRLHWDEFKSTFGGDDD